MGQYHYHALPNCITKAIDKTDGPSHILGVAFDGFPIYGDRAMDNVQVSNGKTFRFEDLLNGGDRDFNDLALTFNSWSGTKSALTV
jgi:YHYH protein